MVTATAPKKAGTKAAREKIMVTKRARARAVRGMAMATKRTRVRVVRSMARETKVAGIKEDDDEGGKGDGDSKGN